MNGIINIYKEKGYTSHDVVAKLRGIMKMKKIGHTGTLDPEATGVLPVCLGNATKLCDILVEKEKEYIATACLGISTDTQDMTGRVIDKADVKVTKEELEMVLEEFTGSYDQIPPMYSAIKVGGKKLYELAREGKEVERKPRKVIIHEIELLEVKFPYFKIRVSCSKGTYIRTLCHDIGMKLGCLAAMAELERTKSGQFTLDTAISLSKVDSLMEEYRNTGDNSCLSFLMAPDQLFLSYPKLVASGRLEKLICNGNPFPLYMADEASDIRDIGDMGRIRIYLSGGEFAAIYEFRKKTGMFYSVQMFL